MNYLSRRIGIWYKDKEWARRIYSELVNHIPNEAIEKEFRNTISSKIVLKDESTITFLPTIVASRGCFFTENYIQEGIIYSDYVDIIRPTFKGKIGLACVVDSVNDFIDRRTIDDYYFDRGR